MPELLTIADIVRTTWIGLDRAILESSDLSNSHSAQFKATSSN